MDRTLIRFLAPRAMVFALAACAGSLELPPETPYSESVVFDLAETDGQFLPDWYAFDVGERRYELRQDGSIRAHGGQRPVWRSTLGLSVEFFEIDQVFYGVDGSHVVVVLALNDGEGGWGVIQRWSDGAAIPAWSAGLPAFNIGEPFAVDRKVYLTGIGTVAKLDLETGDFDWLHRGLYAEGDFNAFRKPYRSDDTVVFISRDHLRPDDDTVYVLVDDITGNILRIAR